METINDRFRRVYKESGLSQEAFAKAIKRGRGEIANIIYDKTEVKDNIIDSVCECFDIREEWLRYGLEPMRAPKTREEEIAEMVGSALTGSSEFKRAVIRMICSRTDAELETLEKALQAVYDNLKKEDRGE